MDILIKGVELPKSDGENELVLRLKKNGVAEVYTDGLFRNATEAIDLPPHTALLNLEDLPVHTRYFDVIIYKQDLIDHFIYRNDEEANNG